MRTKLALAALTAMVCGPTLISAPAVAQNSSRTESSYPQDRVYRGQDGRNRQRCGNEGNGAVGTVAGGAGGALIGHALGGGTVGTLLGAGGGALLGRHFDKKHTRDRNRC